MNSSVLRRYEMNFPRASNMHMTYPRETQGDLSMQRRSLESNHATCNQSRAANCKDLLERTGDRRLVKLYACCRELTFCKWANIDQDGTTDALETCALRFGRSEKRDKKMGKMHGKMLVGASLFALAGLTGRAVAGSPGVPAQTVSAGQKTATVNPFEEPRTEAVRDRQLSGERGSLLINYKDKQSELDSLIKRLQNGESVTPDEIDRAK
jgi:hypothetical protein